MIDIIKNMPDVKIRIVKNEEIIETTSQKIGLKKRIIIFGVPGAFTSTCSIKHLPSYLNQFKTLKKKGIDDIYCLSVNDASVMKIWQSQYSDGNKIIMIADGNADLTKALELDKDYSASFMGLRCKRFTLVSDNNKITHLNIEEPGQYRVSAAEYVINQI